MRGNARLLVPAALGALLAVSPVLAAILPTGSLLINNGAVSTNNAAVTLNLTATDTGGTGSLSMRFRNNTTEPYSAWEPFQATRAWTLPSEIGTRRVYAQFMDGAGNVSDVNPAAAGAQAYMDAIVLYDTTRPTGSILINNGAASTTSTAVTLKLLAADAGGSGLASMRFRNNTADPYSAWEPYQSTRDWTLTGEPGTKRVYVQFMDGSGNISDANLVSAGAQAYSDAIVLYDTDPPTGSILINSGDTATINTAVTLNLQAADPGGTGVVSMRFRNGAADPYGAWEPYRDTMAWTLSGEPGTREVFVQFMDRAGNISDADPAAEGAQGYVDSIVYDPIVATDCEDCHGAPPFPGIGGGDEAPSVMATYYVSGHGTKTFDPDGAGPSGSRAVACADCHELASPNPSTHLNGIFETYDFPGSTFGGPNTNTSHLVAAYFGTGAEADWQVNFDDNCYRNVYCHRNPPARGHRHELSHQDGVARFGDHRTVANPKQARTQPYWTPWTIGDITTNAPPPARHYAPCVACHDPHGADYSGYVACRMVTDGNYHMVKKDFCDPAFYCNSNCHRP